MRSFEVQSSVSRAAVLVAAVALTLAAAVAADAPTGTTAPPPAPFERVEFVGARALDDGVLRRALTLPLPADSVRALLEHLGRLYTEGGFLQVKLRSEPVDEVLRVHIDEGEPTTIAHVFVRGTSLLSSDEALHILGVEVGDVHRGPVLEARLQVLLEEYARRGHLYATAVIERLEVGPDGVVVGIAVSEGPATRLVEVRVQGNSHSRADLVRRLAGIELDGVADLQRLHQAAQLLRRSGLFASVDDALVYRAGNGDEVGVLLRVHELRRRNTVFGTVGVAQDPRDNQPYVNGAVDLRLHNIYGSGRDLAVAWKRDALIGSQLRLGYRERFLLGWPLDLDLDLEQTVRDSTYTWQSAGAALIVPLSRTLSLEVGTAIDRSVFHTQLQGNSRRLRQRVGLLFESLSREEDARRFGDLEVRAEYARKTNDLQVGGVRDHSRVRQTLWSGRFHTGVALAFRHILAVRGEWYMVDSNESEIAESELYYFGGARTLRGFREEQFRGDKVAFGGIEYRFGDPRRGRLYGFVDVGALRRKRAGGMLDESAHVGYGLGLRGQLAAGIFDLSFGVGEERSFSAVKVHVSLLQRF